MRFISCFHIRMIVHDFIICMPPVPGGALQQHLLDSAWKLLYVVLNTLNCIQPTNQHLHNSPKTLTTHCFIQLSTPSIMFYIASYLSLSELTTHTILDLGLNFKLSSQHDDRSFIHNSDISQSF